MNEEAQNKDLLKSGLNISQESIEKKGSVIIIYNEPQEIPEESNFFLIVYFFTIFALELIFKITVGILIIKSLNSPKFTITPIILTILIYYICKFTFNLFYLLQFGNRLPIWKSVYWFEMILSIGYITVFYSFYMYLNGNLDVSSLALFVVPHIVLTLIRFCVGEGSGTLYLPGSFLEFCFSLQILYVMLKLANPAAHSSWSWVLLFVYVVCVGYLVVACVLLVISVIFVLVFVINRNLFQDINSTVIVFGAGFVFYIIWNGFIYYFLLVGVHKLLEAGNIGPNASMPVDKGLHGVGIALVVCAALTLFILMLFYCFLKDLLLAHFNKGKAKEISLTSFAKNFNTGMKPVSGNYFKKENGNEDGEKKGDENNKLDTCVICMDKESEILMKPCGHSGVCQECIIENLKNNNQCPHCREKIDKVYIIFFDEERKEYLAKGVIQVKV